MVQTELVDLTYFFEWKDQIKELVVWRTSSLKGKIHSPEQEVLDHLEVKDTHSKLHLPFVLFDVNKAASNATVECKKIFIQTLIITTY